MPSIHVTFLRFNPLSAIRASNACFCPTGYLHIFKTKGGHCMMKDFVCKNCFKSGKDSTTVQDYTSVWIKLINQLEHSRAILSGAR